MAIEDRQQRLGALAKKHSYEDWEIDGMVAKYVVDQVVKMHDRQALQHFPLTECVTQRQADRGEKVDQYVGLKLGRSWLQTSPARCPSTLASAMDVGGLKDPRCSASIT